MNTHIFTITFAGMKLQFSTPNSPILPPDLTDFLCENSDSPDAEYEIQLLEKPLSLENCELIFHRGVFIYSYKKSWLRVYPALTATDGCQVALFLCSPNKYILYYPASRWEHYASELHLLHLIAGEHLLLQQDSFLLHSSLVEVNGHTVLFSGPSGVGKSTQAALWKKYAGADILNGDRTVIKKNSQGFWGCGSPWSGTSKIHSQKLAPVKGIFLLEQSLENSVKRAGFDAFLPLYTQSIVNSWDEQFVQKITDLISEVLTAIPVYRLSCRPDEEAVRLAYNTLFGKETFS